MSFELDLEKARSTAGTLLRTPMDRDLFEDGYSSVTQQGTIIEEVAGDDYEELIARLELAGNGNGNGNTFRTQRPFILGVAGAINDRRRVQSDQELAVEMDGLNPGGSE